MKIGVLTDTHIHSSEEIPEEVVKAFSEVDLIVHCGDFVTLEVLEGLRQINELKAVRGNMDSDEIKSILSKAELLIINDKRIGIIHGSGAPQGIEYRIREEFGEVDVIIYGHTHEVCNRIIDGVLFFNPGPGRYSYGVLTIEAKITGEIIECH